MPRPTPDEAALLRTICDEPEADLPRLVYADWLEDHDRGRRAEFIRWQIEHHAAWQAGWPRGSNPTIYRETLSQLYRQDYFRELPKWARPCYQNETDDVHITLFRRGFIETLAVEASPFVRFGEQLVERFPIVYLELTHAKKLCRELGKCSALRNIRELDLSLQRLEDDDASELFIEPPFHNLTSLNLSYNNLTDTTARRLAATPALRNLKLLRLEGNDLTMRGATMLAKSLNLQNVELFRFRHNRLLERSQSEVRRLLGTRCEFQPE
jgi:uncharacterized protein (TIGR02996 family)